jgi:hypothetical protein
MNVQDKLSGKNCSGSRLGKGINSVKDIERDNTGFDKKIVGKIN